MPSTPAARSIPSVGARNVRCFEKTAQPNPIAWSVPLTVLTVAYPLAPVGSDCRGVRNRSRPRSIARSSVRGSGASSWPRRIGRFREHIATPVMREPLTSSAKAVAQAQRRAAIATALVRYAVDVVHLHVHLVCAREPSSARGTTGCPGDRERYRRRLVRTARRRNFVLMLGRICGEKEFTWGLTLLRDAA